MPTFALQQVSSPFARENAAKTLEKAIGLRYVVDDLQLELRQVLESACPSGKIYVWGSKLERSPQLTKMLPRNCLVLFRRGRVVYKYGVLIASTISPNLADHLWGPDKDGTFWEFVFFLARVRDSHYSVDELNPALGRSPTDNWQGLTAIHVPPCPELSELFGENGL